jgi:predicted metal-dependent peptidase
MMLEHEKRMIQARMRLIMKPEWAFFGQLGLRLKLRARDTISTLCVDGRTLSYNPDFIMKMPFDHLVGVVAHEIMHCAAGHPMRLGKRHHRTFNEACDYAINSLIVAAGLQLPASALLDPEFDGKAAEGIYSVLYARKLARAKAKAEAEAKAQAEAKSNSKSQAQADDDDDEEGEDDGDGEGDGEGRSPGTDSDTDDQPDDGEGDDGDDGESHGDGAGSNAQDDDDAPAENVGGCGTFSAPSDDGTDQPLSEADAKELERDWQEAVAQTIAIAKKAGNLPGHLIEMFEEVRAPYVDWREQLRRFVDTSAKQDYTWTPPNRRYVAAGLYLPAVTSDGITDLVYVIDTSISMNSAALQCATDEVNAIIDSVKPDRVTVLLADEEVHKVEEFGPDDYPITVKAYGRGGTRFSPSFAKVEELGITPACLVYFTDLECYDFGPEPNYPVLWASTEREGRAPWGEVIHVVVDR